MAAPTNKIDAKALFERLLKADQEAEVTQILTESLLLDDQYWKPLGGIENNWSIAGNQQSEAAQAVAEKIINCIDAVLLYECQKRGIDPTSPAAPQSMEAAAEEFFGVKEGSLETVDDSEALRKMADRIQFIAVGTKSEPSYLIVDTGEGQTPAAFASTFLSLAKSNKWRIPFVQGKYNAGGTGALRFCGSENYQLIVSRRAPDIADRNDPTRDRWGFTLVRRSRPTEGDNRRSSMFVYLVLDGVVPSFAAKEVLLLPGSGDAKRSPEPYTRGIPFGTGIKLYSFRWRSNGTATLEARFALNSSLFRPVLPVRVTEARKGYKANYYSTTVRGGAIDDNPPLDLGPTSASIALPHGMGTLPAELRVFALHEPPAKEDENAEEEAPKPNDPTPAKKVRKRKRHSTGVVFTLNGQRHGDISANVVARKVGFDFLADDLLLVVDVTHMPAELREDIWMTSRDRVADVEEKRMIEDEILGFLRDHQGLRELNNQRKQEWVTQQVEEDEPLDILQELVSEDPALAEVFGVGTKLKRIMPTPGAKKPEPFVGKPFPTYFQLRKPMSVKDCPINRPCRLEFITDVVDDYFSRGRDKGALAIQPPGVNNGFSLYQGICTVRIKLPFNSKVGDTYPVTVEVNDSTQLGPFVTKIQIRVTSAETSSNGGGKRRPRGEDDNNGVNFPKIWEITRDKWDGFKFDDYSGLVFKGGVNGAPLEAYVNMDNRYLQHEKVKAKDESEQKLLNYYYKYGLTILALGLVHEALRVANHSTNGSNGKISTRDACEQVNPILGGLASVVIPVVRRLAKTATKAVS